MENKPLSCGKKIDRLNFFWLTVEMILFTGHSWKEDIFTLLM